MMLAALLVVLASAVEPEIPARLPPVVATATRAGTDPLLVPAAVDVIDDADIHRGNPALSLSESLRRLPGIVARDRQNQAQDMQISIRGFGARASFGVRGIRLYSDGIPASMPDGQGQVSHFSLESASRIEVLRGPFSVLYGNASGGVIEVTSAPPPSEAQAAADFTAGSYSLHRSTLSWRGPLDAGGMHGARLDAADTVSDGYRRHGRAHRRAGQGSFKGQLGAKTRYTLLVNALDLDAEDPQGLNQAELAGDRRAASPNALRFNSRKSVTQRQLGTRVEHVLGSDHVLSLTAYAGDRQTFQMLTVPISAQSNPLSGGGVIDLDRRYRGLDARWQWSTLLGDRPLSLTAGVLREASGERRRGYENFAGSVLGVVGELRRDERNTVQGHDWYAQADLQLSERWRMNAGLRRSRVQFGSRDQFIRSGNPDDSGSLDFRSVSPVAGLLYRATPWLSVYANAGEGFETPTFAELAYRNDGLGGLNDALRPARSRSAEIGLRARRSATEFSFAAFSARTRDELVVASSQGGRTVFANAPLSRRRGLEASWSRLLSDRWRLSANFTFLDATYLEDFAVCHTPPCDSGELLVQSGRRIPGLARHSGWTEIRWSPSRHSDVVLEGRFVDRVFVDDGNRFAAPGYATFDLAFERRLQLGKLHWRGFARLNNLIDRTIIGSVIVNEGNGRYFEPAPGRHWFAGISAMREFD